MTIRRFLMRALTAAFLTATGADAASAAPREPHHKLSDAIDKLAVSNEVVILADTNHLNFKLRNPLSDPAFMDRLYKKGVRDVYLEVSRTFQPLLDAYVTKTLSRQDFIKAMMDQTKIAKAEAIKQYLQRPAHNNELVLNKSYFDLLAQETDIATKAGLHVHFIDPQPVVDTQMLILQDIYDKKNVEASFEQRLNDYDPVVAKTIQETRRGKAIIFYGTLHSAAAMEGNIDDSFTQRGITNATIMVTERQPYKVFHSLQKGAEYLKKILTQIPESPVKGIDIPSYIYNPVSGQILKTNTSNAFFKPVSTIPAP